MQIRLLRSILEWRQDDISSAAAASSPAAAGAAASPVGVGAVGSSAGSGDSTGGAAATGRESIIVLIWPQGSFLLLPKGTTAGAQGVF